MAAALLILVPARVAQAQMVCGERKAIVDALEDGHQERRAAAGLSGSGGLVELYISKGGATWTLVVTIPGGPACLLATGENWESWEPIFETKPKPREWKH